MRSYDIYDYSYVSVTSPFGVGLAVFCWLLLVVKPFFNRSSLHENAIYLRIALISLALTIPIMYYDLINMHWFFYIFLFLPLVSSLLSPEKKQPESNLKLVIYNLYFDLDFSYDLFLKSLSMRHDFYEGSFRYKGKVKLHDNDMILISISRYVFIVNDENEKSNVSDELNLILKNSAFNIVFFTYHLP